MKLFIKNKFASIKGSSKVTNENDEEVFKVKGKFFSLRRKKKIYDLDGNLLFIVKNKLFNTFKHSSFITNKEGQKICKVSNKFLGNGYDVLGYTDEISIDGFSLSGFSIIKNGNQIGTVSCKFFSLVDNYELTTQDDAAPAFLVALIIALDNIRDNKSKQH